MLVGRRVVDAPLLLADLVLAPERLLGHLSQALLGRGKPLLLCVNLIELCSSVLDFRDLASPVSAAERVVLARLRRRDGGLRANAP